MTQQEIIEAQKARALLFSAMAEDEDFRRPTTSIGRLKDDLGIEPHEDLPNHRSEDAIDTTRISD